MVQADHIATESGRGGAVRGREEELRPYARRMGGGSDLGTPLAAGSEELFSCVGRELRDYRMSRMYVPTQMH